MSEREFDALPLDRPEQITGIGECPGRFLLLKGKLELMAGHLCLVGPTQLSRTFNR